MTDTPSETEVAKPANDGRSSGGAPRKKLSRMAQPKPAPPPPPSILTRIVRAPGAWTVVWPIVLVVTAYLLWTNWGQKNIGDRFYRVSESAFAINAAPEYVARNVVSDVFRSHQLEQISLLDRNATPMISEALQTHPWIEEVIRVEKSNSGVTAQVRYRTPVAMVRVISQHKEVQGPAVCVVDAKGTLLPTEGFSESDVPNYLQIEIDGSYPVGVNYGMPFSDLRVLAACEIASLLLPLRKEADLAAIRLSNPQRTFNEPWLFVLIRKDGSQIVWGSPPGEELAGENLASEKLAMLRTEDAQGSRPIIPRDLRTRVARTSLPQPSTD